MSRRPAGVVNALQTLVSRLRRALPAVPIVSLPSGYRLDLPADAIDVLRFETLASVRDPAALSLWRGEEPAFPDPRDPRGLGLSPLAYSFIAGIIEHARNIDAERVEVSANAAAAWRGEVVELFGYTLVRETGEDAHSWFVGANIEGKTTFPLFYFGPAIDYVNRCDGEATADYPNFDFASSSVIPIVVNTRSCTSTSWIRIEPDPSSQTFHTRS